MRPLMLPPRSPNLNAFAERWLRSAKEECLAKLILFGEAHSGELSASSLNTIIPNVTTKAEKTCSCSRADHLATLPAVISNANSA